METSFLDYLADRSVVLANIVPDKDGVVTVKKAALGPHAMIRVVAVDPLAMTVRHVALPEQPANVLDLRLRTGLDPKGHFTQQKQVSFLRRANRSCWRTPRRAVRGLRFAAQALRALRHAGEGSKCTNKAHFHVEEAVSLDLYVKNVPTLIVKVFEINAANFYKDQKREIDTDINLDGLVPNVELTFNYAEPPLRRVARKFEFPQLNKAGVYVIDFIGAGKSSRALVRKGRLRPLAATGTAGQVITIVDERNRPVTDATVWLGGTEYLPEKDGTVLIPFSTAPGRQPIVLARGDFASLDYLDHQPENYQLVAGIHVDREQLLSQRIAQVLVRPALMLNGQPVSTKLLEEVKLRIVGVDSDGIQTATEVPNFKLFEDRESVHEFRVPPRLVDAERHAPRQGEEPDAEQIRGRGRRPHRATQRPDPDRQHRRRAPGEVRQRTTSSSSWAVPANPKQIGPCRWCSSTAISRSR